MTAKRYSLEAAIILVRGRPIAPALGAALWAVATVMCWHRSPRDMQVALAALGDAYRHLAVQT